MNDDSLEQPHAGRIVPTITTYSITPPCGKEPYEPCDVPCCLEKQSSDILTGKI